MGLLIKKHQVEIFDLRQRAAEAVGRRGFRAVVADEQGGFSHRLIIGISGFAERDILVADRGEIASSHPKEDSLLGLRNLSHKRFAVELEERLILREKIFF